MAQHHPIWIVREGNQVLTIEIVTGRLILATPGAENFAASAPETVRDLRRKVGWAISALAELQGIQIESTEPGSTA